MLDTEIYYIHVFERHTYICVYNALTLEKVYLSKELFKNQKIQNLTWDIVNFENEHPKLNNIQIAVTTKCNFLCRYCQLKQNDNPCKIESMSLEVAERIYSKYKDIFLNGTVMITGGEPLLNWEVTRYLIKLSKHRKIVFTNCSLLRPEIAKQLYRENVFVIASIDGPKEVNDFSRNKANGESAYFDIIRGIEYLRSFNCRFGISLVVNESNINNLCEICEWLINELNPLSLGVNIPHYTKRYLWDLPEETLVEQFLGLFSLSKRYNIFIDQISRVLTPLTTEKIKIRDCSACGSKVVVYPDGNISNCIVKFLFTSGNDLDIWAKSSPLYTQDCKKCYAIGVCGGGCKFDGEMFFGKDSFDFRRCLVTKKLTETMIWDIFDSTKEQKPTTEQMRKAYSSITNNPLSVTWSVGHDT